LFACGLFNDAFSVTMTYSVELKGIIINWKGFGREESRPNCEELSQHSLGGIGENHERPQSG
jgi:hypothetical protein